MKRKYFFSFVLCFVLSTFSIFAQPSQEVRQGMKASRKEVREYVKTNIFPALKSQRAKLENQISAEDKTKLADLRQRIKVLKTESKNFKKHHKKAHGENHDENLGEGLSEADREKMHEAAQKMRRIMLEAWVIADNYDKTIRLLLGELKPQSEKWKTDIKALLEKNMPAEMKEKIQKHAKHEKGDKMTVRHFGKLKKAFSPAGFILLDPNAKMPSLEDEESEETTSDLGTTITIFPNPSAEANMIRFTTKEKGKIIIYLLDKDNRTLRTILDETRDAGEQNVKVNITDLKNGIYYYQIISPSGKEVKRFLKE